MIHATRSQVGGQSFVQSPKNYTEINVLSFLFTMRAALAVCERFQHESSSPCYRSSGGWVECSRLSESAASCGATSSADTTSSSPGSRYRAREARRSSARSLRFVGRRACTPSGQPGPFQSPCLNRPVDRQAYLCMPSKLAANCVPPRHENGGFKRTMSILPRSRLSSRLPRRERSARKSTHPTPH